jgi:hypothetical protein
MRDRIVMPSKAGIQIAGANMEWAWIAAFDWLSPE